MHCFGVKNFLFLSLCALFIIVNAIKQQYRDLLLHNADVFSKDKYDIGRTSEFQHKIHLRNNEPCFTKQFTLPDAYREGVDKHIHEWLKLGVIVPAQLVVP